jgi:glycerol uptake facilitator-like aquaporin
VNAFLSDHFMVASCCNWTQNAPSRDQAHIARRREGSGLEPMVELSELRPTFTPAVAAELIGSFLLLFLSGASAATAADNGLAAAALGYGLTLTILIYSTAHISGGHLNPAVTAGYMAVPGSGFSIRKLNFCLRFHTQAACTARSIQIGMLWHHQQPHSHCDFCIIQPRLFLPHNHEKKKLDFCGCARRNAHTHTDSTALHVGL